MDTAFVARTANAWSWIEKRAKRIIRSEQDNLIQVAQDDSKFSTELDYKIE